MSSDTHTGANGDHLSRFTDAGARRVDHEDSPSSSNTQDISRAVAPDTGKSSSSVAPDHTGPVWRSPENRGAGGEFDDWNPRGEMGSGPAVVGTPTLGERVKGEAEKVWGELTNNADRVDSGEKRQVGL